MRKYYLYMHEKEWEYTKILFLFLLDNCICVSSRTKTKIIWMLKYFVLIMCSSLYGFWSNWVHLRFLSEKTQGFFFLCRSSFSNCCKWFWVGIDWLIWVIHSDFETLEMCFLMFNRKWLSFLQTALHFMAALMALSSTQISSLWVALFSQLPPFLQPYSLEEGTTKVKHYVAALYEAKLMSGSSHL